MHGHVHLFLEFRAVKLANKKGSVLAGIDTLGTLESRLIFTVDAPGLPETRVLSTDDILRTLVN